MQASGTSEPLTEEQEALKIIKTLDEQKWSFRVCKICQQTRVLDERATKKFPLGSYQYGNNEVHVEFTCDRLVNTTCETEEDILPFDFYVTGKRKIIV